MNIGEPWPDADAARLRVLKIQTKLHQWARDDSDRRFDDLFNLVYDPAVLVDAWQRVLGNRGARSAGVDGQIAYYIRAIRGEQAFLSELRDQLKARTFRPDPVREVMIPKPGGKRRRLGIATVRDRVVQAALKTVLEPIFEADFQPCSYGFRPRRRAQDAIAEIHYLTSRSYEWVVEGDIKACFDEISHSALLQRMRGRIADKRVLDLVKAFLKSDILGEDRRLRESNTGAHRAGSSRPCSPTSHCRSWTSISPGPGSRGEILMPGSIGAAKVWPTIASCDMRTISSSWWPGTGATPRICGMRQQGFFSQWGFGSRRRRR